MPSTAVATVASTVASTTASVARSARSAAALLLAFTACTAEIPVADDDLPAPTAPANLAPPTPGAAASRTSGPEGAPPATTSGRVATAPANGYGDRIAWRGLDEGLQEAAASGRPLMLVIHAAWCPRCKELKQRFFDPPLADASERFVMVNLDQDAQPEGLRYAPDGSYIPRVLFLDAHGQIDAGLSNPGRSKYKYFYSHRDDLVAAMQTALARHGTH